MKQITVKIGVIFAVIFLTIGSLWAVFEELPGLGVFPFTYVSTSKKNVHELIPADSTLIVAADLGNLDFATLQKLLKNMPIYPVIEQVFNNFLIQRESYIHLEQDIMPWLDREIGITVLDMAPSVPETVFLLKSRNLPRTRRFLEKFISYTNQQYVEKQYQKYKIFQIAITESSGDFISDLSTEATPESTQPPEEKSLQLNLAIIENFLVIAVSDNSNAIQKIITTVQGKTSTVSKNFFGDSDKSAVVFYYQPPNQQNEATMIESVRGELFFVKDKITFNYSITGLRAHLQHKNLTLSGNNVQFFPTLFSILSNQTIIGLYLIPSINTLLIDSNQPVPLPFSEQRDQFQRNLVQILRLSFEDVLSLAGKETAFVITTQGFGFISKINDLSKNMLIVQKMEESLNKGVNFDHFLKSTHKGEINNIAYFLVKDNYNGIEITTVKNHYALNLTALSDAESKDKIINPKLPIEENEIDWTPSWAIVENNFVWFSSLQELQTFIKNLKNNPISDNLPVKDVLSDKEPLQSLFYLKGKDFGNLKLGKAVNLDFGFKFGLVGVDEIFPQIIAASSSTTAVWRGDSYNTRGKIILTLE